jgi:hypothetical protein
MSREIYSIKGNPRPSLKAPGNESDVCCLTLVMRLRSSPMNRKSANLRFDGNQGANISLTERRVKFLCSFHYFLSSFADVGELFLRFLIEAIDRRHIISGRDSISRTIVDNLLQ